MRVVWELWRFLKKQNNVVSHFTSRFKNSNITNMVRDVPYFLIYNARFFRLAMKKYAVHEFSDLIDSLNL